MNFPMIRYVLSAVLRVEGLLFALPLITAAVYREWAVAPVYLVLLVGCVAVGCLLHAVSHTSGILHAPTHNWTSHQLGKRGGGCAQQRAR